jgi:hypothetical protein
MMAADDATAGSMLTPPMISAGSTFNNFPADFQKWGYTVRTQIRCDMDNDQYGIEAALGGIGVSTRKTDWKCYTTHHGNPYRQPAINDQAYVLEGRTYRVSSCSHLLESTVNNASIGNRGKILRRHQCQ